MIQAETDLHNIRRAFERQLATVTPTYPVARENAAFPEPKDAKAPYLRLWIRRARPEAQEIGGEHRRELGFAQVDVLFAEGAGTEDAEAHAMRVAMAFPYSTVITHDTATVHTSGWPEVLDGRPDDGRWSIPVRIPWFADFP
jgi:hypothetical protein